MSGHFDANSRTSPPATMVPALPIASLRVHSQTALGLIDTPRRSAAGYRLYDDGHLQQMHFIRAARELGFDFSETRQLIRLSAQPQASCAAIDALTRSHIADIDHRIERLQRLRRVLARLLATCHGDILRTVAWSMRYKTMRHRD